ncbi:MAG: potassium-transporting ATPase subunit KdpB [Nitrososphaerota archaeon]|jgi:K+-transporting ATPase ATPase B chain|nr:potassium-transporting ATPase subunit KdpB [Nitrososphaerota archaeon]MDG6927218.1 potassium-transporting ATPase subunit KdpB [Nitrososphaerota archaeon]MDG6929724.1 potassium-transporting ATPase subunit KdpB [Nitrososphaerota archaeon]MDG6932661.1 potassium-transporting ATPase subunit KdpB [Nitrososphaerota archaeon]MDG6936119.1 potassium-transporting ATPase subunit KdpB [Nitrososphaerota archaeon]
MELKTVASLLGESFKRLSPTYLYLNPVLFMTEISFIIVALYMLVTKSFSLFYISVLSLIFITVWFGTFADSLAEFQAKATAKFLISVTQANLARKIMNDNSSEILIKPEELVKGDIILVNSGEIVPVDGVIIDGAAAIDESLVSGESIPVIKSVNDEVVAGSRVSSDWLKIKVVKPVGESYVSKIADMIEKTKRPKSQSEQELNLILYVLTAIFTVVIIALFVIVGALGYRPNPAILLAFYVCLLPTTIGALHEAIGISGIARMWKIRVISKSGRAIESAGDVDDVLLDKTGTITIGRREPISILPFNGIQVEDVARAAFIASLNDDTQEGKSIIRFLQNSGYTPDNLDSIITSTYEEFSAKTRKSGTYYKPSTWGGKEMRGKLHIIRKSDLNGIYLNDEIPVFKGAPDVMKKIFSVPSDFDKTVEDIAKKGNSPLIISYGDKIIGVIELKDIIKPGVKTQIESLKKMAIEPIMVTGDHPLTARNIANEVSINEVIAQAKPEDKYKKVQAEQDKGKTIAMVGDGTNDAPALARANVGLAMYQGTEVAKEAANMVDLESDPSKIIDVIMIGKQILITRGSIATFSIANDLAKYFVILPAMLSTISALSYLNILKLPPHVSVISALIYNAIIIPALIPLAIKGIGFKPDNPNKTFLKNMLIYGLGGMVLPFIAIKLIGIILMLHIVL